MYILTQKTVAESGFVEYCSRTGQPETIILPDGSSVLANSGTLILYPKSYGKDTRTVYLFGEANFKVQKNADLPFIVKSKNISVTALGTEFDVSAYPEASDFQATLINGSIRIQHENLPINYTLNVNEQFSFNDITGNYAVAPVDIYDITSWHRGELVFKGATMLEILTVLERKYTVSFQYKSTDFNNDKYNFRFKKESSLTNVLDIIKEVADDFTYREAGDSLYIN
jgi:ferric-dicitrate binding protein FerR (iron transport regulator)